MWYNRAMRDTHILQPFHADDHDHNDCVRNLVQQAESLCSEQGLRFTPHRRQVLELVVSSHLPVKAYDLLEKMQRLSARTAPPTVYRALDFLLEHGLIHRIESLNAFVACGDVKHKHNGQFFICQSCSRVAEIDDPDILIQLTKKAEELGFSDVQPIIEIKGVCNHCNCDR